MLDNDIPLYHFPGNVGLNTGMEISANWLLALNEIRALAAESRRRRAIRDQVQANEQVQTSRAA